MQNLILDPVLEDERAINGFIKAPDKIGTQIIRVDKNIQMYNYEHNYNVFV